jgi:hypothetical protein
MISRIIPFVLVLAAIGLFFGYINPTYAEKVGALRTEIRSYDDALDAAEEFEKKESQLMTERANIPPDGLVRIEAFLPDGVDNVQLILDLNALAERSGLTLSDFDITENNGAQDGDALALESEGQIESLDLAVSATGNYASFKSFLEGAEWSLRPLDLIELDIEDSETGVYTYQIKFRIYWLR